MSAMGELRGRVYRLLNPDDRSDRLSHAVNLSIIALVVLNVVCASLETVHTLYDAYRPIFWSIEIASITIFSLEYVLRFWSATENVAYTGRLQYFFSFNSIVDLLAVVPFFIGLLFGLDLRALVVLRLLRLLKLVRYFQPLAILGAVMKAEFRGFMTAMFVLVILVFVAATGIYIFEREAQPEVFGSIPQSMWWAIVTLTTLGYGDVIPITVPGRVFAALITVFSIGAVALPAGMLASRFSEELKKRKDEMDDHITKLAAAGGVLDLERLEQLRDELCLSEDDVQQLLERHQERHDVCPLCQGKGEYR